MKKRHIGLLIVLCLIIATAIQTAFADDGQDFTIDNTRIVTGDRDAAYIEGTVDKASGQTILVKLGLRVIAEKVLPATGSSESFRIKIPEKYISEKRLNVFNVLEKDADGSTTGKDRVEISYVEREEQEIKVAEKEYNLTYPGLDADIGAKASSGDDLIYSSSNPEVASVDEDGKIITSGGGEATIKVQQIGNSQYGEAEKEIKVSVEELDAYTITYHSSADDGDDEIKQIVATDVTTNLDDNPFINGDHKFLGWARSDDGLVEFTDAEQVTDLGETGENVDLYAVWTGDGARAAVAWACMIANDDSFTYGAKPATSSMGCYFCGTNQRNKPSGYEKTYVCLTFVTAAFAHGAEDPEMMRDCSSGRDCVVCNDDNFYRYSCWKKIGYCSDLSVDDLLPGDVISWYNEDGYDNGHVAIYAGNNMIVDAEGIDACWSPASIAIRNEGSYSLRDAANHHGRSYVMRYVGPNAGK
jgi:hypothetical protein